MKSVYQQIVLATSVVICLSACSDNNQPSNGAVEPAQSAAKGVQLTPRQAEMWARSCALCHVDGNARAPRLGHADEWAERAAGGMELMLSRTLDGYNDMPPLGYCMACEREDFVALIGFMTQTTPGATP